MKRLFTRLLCLTIASSMFLSSASAISPVRPATGEPDPTVVRSAIESFNKLSKKEKNERKKNVKQALKDLKAKHGTSAAPSTNTVLLVILAILLPPLAVYLHQGEINSKFWLSVVLTILGWIPGVIYALVLIL